jgi:signal transduction histidine kinase
MTLRQRISTFAHQPGDTAETSFKKSLILIVALLCCACGLVWSATYAVVFGASVVTALPLVFVAIVGSAIVVSARRGSHLPVVYAQLTCIMCVTAVIQWTIGSAAGSGLVICWSFLGPVGALIWLPLHRAKFLMAVFLLIVVVSVGFEPALLGAPLPVPHSTQMIFLAMNLGASLLIVFIATAWSSANLTKALADLKEAQVRLVDTEKQAIVGRLVAGVLHEMNTPLGVIRSSTQTMAQAVLRCGTFMAGRADEETRLGKRVLRTIEALPALRNDVDASIERLGSVVDGLSRFVSLDEAERKSIDVRESLDTALSLLAHALGDRIEVKRRYEDTLPEVFCLAAKLSQIFLSVLQNAVDAIDDTGSIEVSASAAGETFVVTITDDGRGMPAHQLEGIFELGFSKQAGRIGMRLGLPMSKRHLDEMGGQIAIESTDGAGTTVRISLPLPTV